MPAHRIVANQELSPEERRAMELFEAEFGDAVDETLASQIERRIRAGSIDLGTERSVRRGIGRHIEEFRKEFGAVARVAGEDALRAGRVTEARQFGLSIGFDRIPRSARDELDEWVTTISEEVPDTVEDEMTSYLRGAHEEGLSVDDIARDLEEEFVEGRLKGSKAEQLARDNTVAPSNAGKHSANQDAPNVVAEEWLATHDGRARDSHLDADGQITGVDTPFLVGGHQADHPGDPTLPVEESTNCRCSIVPVQARELSEQELAQIEAGGRVWR